MSYLSLSDPFHNIYKFLLKVIFTIKFLKSEYTFCVAEPAEEKPAEGSVNRGNEWILGFFFFFSISWFELTETIYYHPQTQCLQELQQRKGCRWLRRGKRVRNQNLKTSKCFSVNPWCSVFVFHGFWYIMTKTTAMFQSILQSSEENLIHWSMGKQQESSYWSWTQANWGNKFPFKFQSSLSVKGPNSRAENSLICTET